MPKVNIDNFIYLKNGIDTYDGEYKYSTFVEEAIGIKAFKELYLLFPIFDRLIKEHNDQVKKGKS